MEAMDSLKSPKILEAYMMREISLETFSKSCIV